MRVFLIGLPGAGKTTLGKELALQLNVPFVDLDTAIETGERQSVTGIFNEKGEAAFRDLERYYLNLQLAAGLDFVMATGGGTPCFHDNLNQMNAAGITVFLDVPAREIIRRMELSQTDSRPLLADVRRDELKDRIEFLRTQRLPFYRQAYVTVAGDAITVADLLKTASQSLRGPG